MVFLAQMDNFTNVNGYRIRGYIDRGNFSSIQVANMNLIYWSVCSSSRREGDGVKEVDGRGVVILDSY